MCLFTASYRRNNCEAAIVGFYGGMHQNLYLRRDVESVCVLEHEQMFDCV